MKQCLQKKKRATATKKRKGGKSKRVDACNAQCYYTSKNEIQWDLDYAVHSNDAAFHQSSKERISRFSMLLEFDLNNCANRFCLWIFNAQCTHTHSHTLFCCTVTTKFLFWFENCREVTRFAWFCNHLRSVCILFICGNKYNKYDDDNPHW